MAKHSAFPFQRPVPLTAVSLVESMQALQADAWEQHLRSFGALPYAKALLNGGASEAELHAPSQRILDSLQITAGDWAINQLWYRTKIVYDVDPTMMRTLADMDTSDLLPGGVLHQLPHPNPVFVFTEGHHVLHKDDAPGILRAMYVTGRRSDNTLCGTNDPDVAQYQLTFNSDLVDKVGNVVDIDSLRISFALTDDSFTIRRAIDEVLRNFRWEPLLTDSASPEEKRQYMESLVHFGLAHLLYVCSEKADTRRRPIGRKPAKKGERPQKPLQVHELGWHVGAAIKSTRELIENDRRSAVAAGKRTMQPHVRRAHLHTFRHGKGRALSKVKWLPPIFVNANGDSVNLDGTIIPVQK
ncbi:hypothetical protein GCM10010331_44320 [Streptomyces xanthochromogenes]|uniref:hypothetical protein n=1 Tax=Streptomyces xanthochromogenes TaxID=67384 RepID=UPI00167AE25D|nr:hypothetical protein [Streptomyces xanthochromogenes]GHB51910.1 hypothetical protein GCM10010331_44320 [Streptomyces xanthochromogenes]